MNCWAAIVAGDQRCNAERTTGYGIGWRRTDDDHGHTWIGHSGGSVGGITQMIAYPQQKVVVAMLTNSDKVQYGEVHHRIAHLFFTE